MWTALTVMLAAPGVLVTICSFSVTVPYKGSLITVLGAGAKSTGVLRKNPPTKAEPLTVVTSVHAGPAAFAVEGRWAPSINQFNFKEES